MSILISAGHTNKPGQDRGMQGNGYIEGVEATRLRDDVAAVLRAAGHTVIEDGSDGVNDPLKRAIALARTAQTAVEFHFNAGPPKATGIEVLSKPKHKALAQRIAGAIHTATGLVLRGEKGWKSDSSGQHHRLGFCQVGGLIVEVCFMSSEKDMAAYKANYPNLATSLAMAISGNRPALSDSSEAPARDLKIGDRGADVIILQEKLGVTPDGDFGLKTKKAVINIQVKNNLRADGIVGNRTRAVLGL